MHQYCNGHNHTQNNIERKSRLTFLPGKSGAVRMRAKKAWPPQNKLFQVFAGAWYQFSAVRK